MVVLRHAAPAALAALLACNGDASAPPSARIEFIDGALEPLLTVGRPIVIEGLGFGSAPGSVTFTRAGGGTVEAAVTADAWSPALVTISVPAGAASGTVTLRPAASGAASAAVHVIPDVPFSPAALAWLPRTGYPGAPAGVAVATAEIAGPSGVSVTVYAAGGGAPQEDGSLAVTDSGIYVARPAADGAPGSWARQVDNRDPALHRNLPAPRAFAAAVVATRYNSRFSGSALYVLGGLDGAGRPRATVYAADVTAAGVAARFVTIEPLPAPVAGAVAVVSRGRIYVSGGADSAGRPLRRAFVGRIGLDGRIDGWFEQPMLPGPRAYGGGVLLDHAIAVFGGVADSVPPGGGLDATPARLVTSDTAPVSLASGFFRGPWTTGAELLPAGRSQFATLILSGTVLVVGGVYAGATTDPVETLAAAATGDVLGPFAGPVGGATIHGQGGGTLVGPAGAAWRGPDGTPHGLVLGGIDLLTGLGRGGVWGF